MAIDNEEFNEEINAVIAEIAERSGIKIMLSIDRRRLATPEGAERLGVLLLLLKSFLATVVETDKPEQLQLFDTTPYEV